MFKEIYRLLNSLDVENSDILILRGIFEEPKTFKAKINKFKDIVKWQKIQ